MTTTTALTTGIHVINNAIDSAARDLSAAKAARIKAENALADAEAAEDSAAESLAELRASAAVLAPDDDGPVIEPPVTAPATVPVVEEVAPSA